MGSKAPATTTQTNKVELSPDQQAIQDLATPYATQFAKTPLQLPNIQTFNPTVLGFNPNEIAGQNSVLDAAQGSMANLAHQAASTNSFLMDPSLLSPESNPFLKAQGDAVTQTATDNLTKNILPALRSGSVVAGGFNSGGNTRFGLAQGTAVGNTNKDITNALANLYGGAYQNGLSTLLSATAQNPSVMQQQLAPGIATAGVGDLQRQLAQAQSNQGVANQQADANLQAQLQWLQQQLPFMQSQQLMSLISSMPGASGVSSVTGAQPGTSLGSGIMGGAATGASLGSLFPGIGTAVGGGVGALAGGLSSLFNL